jgi:hypothetical protein
MWILILNWSLIVGLALAVVLLWIKVVTQASVIAQVLDIHTDALDALRSAAKPAEYPKYLGAFTDLPMECETPEDATSFAVDVYVGSILARLTAMNGPQLPDPETAPFFVGEGDK